MPYTAASNPFANAGTSMFGKELSNDQSSSSSEEPSFLKTLLATVVDQTGLKDWLNPPKGGVPPTPTDMTGFQQKNPAASFGVPPPNQFGSGILPSYAPVATGAVTSPVTNPTYHPTNLELWKDQDTQNGY